MYGPGRIVNFKTIFSYTFYTLRRSCVIILSVSAEYQCFLMILNIFNKRAYTVNIQEKEDFTQSLLKDIEDAKVEILRASNSITDTLYLRNNSDKEIFSLKSKQFQSWFGSHYANGNVLSNSEINTAIKTIEHRAAEDKGIIERRVFTRVGYLRDKDGEKICLCLHNKEHRVVKIASNDDNLMRIFEATTPIPMIFEKTENMSSLVGPTYEYNKKGHIDPQKTLPHLNDLRKYVNVNDEGLCLVIAWLLISLYQNPNVDAPILWIEGERNTGKTTAAKFLKRLIAPDTARMLSQYMSEKEFLAALNSQYVSVIDNVSTIAPKFSDMLCRAVTGDKIRTVTTENGTSKNI